MTDYDDTERRIDEAFEAERRHSAQDLTARDAAWTRARGHHPQSAHYDVVVSGEYARGAKRLVPIYPNCIPKSTNTLEMSAGGHRVRILRRDHPALEYRLGPCVPIDRYPYRVTVWAAWCSCGKVRVADVRRDHDESDYNRAVAERWASGHIEVGERRDHLRNDVRWTRANGWVPTIEGEKDEMTVAVSRRAALKARRDEIEEELAKLADLPDEPFPASEDGQPNVVWFIKSFGTLTEYVYAAVRTPEGLWYTTGPRAPKGYVWEKLIEWINEDEDGRVEIWAAEQFTVL